MNELKPVVWMCKAGGDEHFTTDAEVARLWVEADDDGPALEVMPLYAAPGNEQAKQEALQKLLEACDLSDDFQYSTLSTRFVRGLVEEALQVVKDAGKS